MESSGHRYAEVMIEYSPVGVALVDAHNFCLLTANPFYHTFLDQRWHEGQALGRPLSDWLPLAEESGVAEVFRTVAATGVPYRVDTFPFSGFERGATYWNWSLEPLRGPDGHIHYLMVTAYEVTAQVQAGQQAEYAQGIPRQAKGGAEEDRRRLAVIESVARSIQVSSEIKRRCQEAISTLATRFPVQEMFLHIADTDQPTLYLLGGYQSILGADLSIKHPISYESLLPIERGLPPRDLFLLPDLQAQDNLPFGEYLRALFRANARGYLCIPLWHKETLEGTLTATFSTPIAVCSPEVEAFVESGVNIAAALALNRRHNAREREHAQLSAILDHVPEGILILDAITGTINYANSRAGELVGVSPSELVGYPFHLLARHSEMSEQDRAPVFTWDFPALRVLTGEALTNLEASIVKSDGSCVAVRCSGASLRLGNGEISGAIILFRDITNQKQIEQEKDSFLAMISHELRTPMTVITGYIELLEVLISQGGNFDIHRFQQVFSHLGQQSGYLSQLIEDLLDVAHIDAGQFLLQAAPCDLLSLLRGMIEDLEVSTGQRHIHLAFEGIKPGEPILIWGDEHQLVRVFNNLISNALKYSPDHRDIGVGIRAAPGQPDEVVCWVKDEGMGIAAEELQHIFARFYRSKESRYSTRGLGIGLYMVKEIVEAHGGRVWAESKPGQGSTFFVALPLGSA